MNDLSMNRRVFLRGAGAAGGVLAVAINLPQSSLWAASATASDAPATLVPYIVIDSKGAVKLWSPTTEMGQGTHTAHAAIIADELGVDLARVSIETAEPSDPFRRGQPGQTGSMGSGGSWGVRAWAQPLRTAAAQAREMLIETAAERWNVAAQELRAQDGEVLHASGGRRVSFGELAAAASLRQPPDSPALRPPSERRYVGSTSLRRLDVRDKVAGQTVFSADFRRPGMLYACGRLAPVRGAEVARIDRDSLRGLPGIIDVVTFPGGAAVVAGNQWAAMRAASALRIEFTATPGDALDSATISKQMRQGLSAPSRAVARDEGDFDAVRAGAARVISADYEVPYLNHAPMELWSCTVERGADGTWQLWAPTQVQDRTRNTAARTLNVPVEQVRVHTLMLGGGFGRRLADDGVAPAVLVSKALDGRAVKFLWDREEEFLAGFGRPCAMGRLTAALDSQSRLVGLHVRTSGPSMMRSFSPAAVPAELDSFVDFQALQNLAECRYRVGAHRLDYSMRHNHFPTGPWRSVGATQCAFFLETFIDEIARATDRDPLALRRELLAHDARALRVIDTVAERAGWGAAGRGTAVKPLPEGRALGLAYFESYGSLCAQIAEVSLGADGLPRVHRITCVLDCGEIVTPDGVHAQMQGGVLQGLSAAMFEAATLERGAAVERNFDRYRLLRINEAPQWIDTHIIESGAAMGGVGEPPVPPTAPAVANALARLTGVPIRRLPLVPASA